MTEKQLKRRYRALYRAIDRTQRLLYKDPFFSRGSDEQKEQVRTMTKATWDMMRTLEGLFTTPMGQAALAQLRRRR